MLVRDTTVDPPGLLAGKKVEQRSLEEGNTQQMTRTETLHRNINDLRFTNPVKSLTPTTAMASGVRSGQETSSEALNSFFTEDTDRTTVFFQLSLLSVQHADTKTTLIIMRGEFMLRGAQIQLIMRWGKYRVDYVRSRSVPVEHSYHWRGTRHPTRLRSQGQPRRGSSVDSDSQQYHLQSPMYV